MENTEKRNQTRSRLKKALIDLCDNKSYYDITIWDICNTAGTYRSTFYRYYDTKDEMLREIEENYIQDTRSLTPSFSHFNFTNDKELRALYHKELTADMEYHLAHKKICKFLLSPAGDIYFYNKMLSSIAENVRNAYLNAGESIDTHLEYIINFFASGYIATIDAWLNRNNCTAEQIAGTLLEMIEKISGK